MPLVVRVILISYVKTNFHIKTICVTVNYNEIESYAGKILLQQYY